MRAISRTEFTAVLIVIVILALASVASSAPMPGHISTVEIYVDGFVCATCVRNIENTLKQEEGVAEVSGDWEKGIVAVTPDQNIGWVNLFDFAQRINGTRNYKVLKMNVAAVGTVVKYPVEYYTGGLYAYSGDRYKLQIKDARKAHFILTRNDKLDELIGSGHRAVRVIGTVSSFSEGVPIMEITEFEALGGDEEAKMVKSYGTSPEVLPDHISSIELYIDGFICATCVRVLESNLMTEEGVAGVEADLDKGIVTVTPAMDGDQVDPFYLRRRVNSLREYSVRRMDVEAVGTLVKFPVRYFQAREYSHSHDRYKLQVGDKYFILARNNKLDQLIAYGYKRVRLRGTARATSEGKSILVISAFQEAGDESPLTTYIDPLDAIVGPLADEEEIMEREEHAQIDSVRIYVDGFICATCERPLKDALLLEEGVEITHTDASAGLIEIVPKEGKPFDLLDVEQRINATRGYGVLKMDVVATGKVKAVEMGYAEDTLYPEKHTRYTLFAGESASFLLSENDKLSEMLRSGDEVFVVVGTVTAFRGNVPILYVDDYKKLEKWPEWLQTE